MTEQAPTVNDRKNWYDKNYKLTMIIPIVLLLFSIFYLYNFVSKNGDVLYKDVSLTGGTTLTLLDENANTEELKNALTSQFPDISIRKISDFSSGSQKGLIIETKAGAEELKDSLEKYLGYSLNQDNSSIEFSGAALSTGFYQQLRLAIFLAFIFMAIVVFLVFRTFIPSFAVILSAFADIIMTIVAVDILGMNMSLAGIIAFLMLIGYSVDTDILLTSRVLKRTETNMNAVLFDAFKTGITMTLTSIVAVAVSLYIIYSLSDTLRQIFTILLIGLGFDILNTWLTNAPMLRWYIESKEIRK